jgi:hypothetical protein
MQCAAITAIVKQRRNDVILHGREDKMEGNPSDADVVFSGWQNYGSLNCSLYGMKIVA